jgi:hypothetical protein
MIRGIESVAKRKDTPNQGVIHSVNTVSILYLKVFAQMFGIHADMI